VIKTAGWACRADKSLAGEYDGGAIAYGPCPGDGPWEPVSTPSPSSWPAVENINGQAIRAARHKHKGQNAIQEWFKGFRFGVALRIFHAQTLLLALLRGRTAGPPIRISDPCRCPPPDMSANLSAGNLEWLPFPRSVQQRGGMGKGGFIHLLTRISWEGSPVLRFACHQPLRHGESEHLRALFRANRRRPVLHQAETARKLPAAIAAAHYLNQPWA